MAWESPATGRPSNYRYVYSGGEAVRKGDEVEYRGRSWIVQGGNGGSDKKDPSVKISPKDSSGAGENPRVSALKLVKPVKPLRRAGLSNDSEKPPVTGPSRPVAPTTTANTDTISKEIESAIVQGQCTFSVTGTELSFVQEYWDCKITGCVRIFPILH